MSARVVGILAVAALLMGLVGCGSKDAAAPGRDHRARTLTAGTCWGGQQLPDALGARRFAAWVDEYAGGSATLAASMRDDAAFSDRVDCSAPHSLELYHVVGVSPRLTARIKQYADLLDQKSALYRLVRDQVNDRCMAGTAYGRAEREAGGLPVQLGPSLSADSGLRVAWDPFPADLWAAGKKRFVCTFEQSRPGTLRFADLTTDKVPVAARVCLDTPSTYLPCSGRHQAENIGEMILNTAIAKGAINGRPAVRTSAKGAWVALSDAEYARLDKVCQTLLDAVSSTKDGVVARAYPGSAAQWPSRSGAYVASCFALEPLDPPPATTGTVFNQR